MPISTLAKRQTLVGELNFVRHIFSSIMAAGNWRSVARRVGSTRRLSTSTTPKMKPMSSVGAGYINHDHSSKLRETKAEFTPIGVMLGLVLMALTIDAHTAKQQLVHSPGARVSKKKREMMAEVEEPKHVAGEADRFVTKSFARKVAHLQDFDAVRSDPSPPSIRSSTSHGDVED